MPRQADFLLVSGKFCEKTEKFLPPLHFVFDVALFKWDYIIVLSILRKIRSVWIILHRSGILGLLPENAQRNYRKQGVCYYGKQAEKPEHSLYRYLLPQSLRFGELLHPQRCQHRHPRAESDQVWVCRLQLFRVQRLPLSGRNWCIAQGEADRLVLNAQNHSAKHSITEILQFRYCLRHENSVYLLGRNLSADAMKHTDSARQSVCCQHQGEISGKERWICVLLRIHSESNVW